MAEKTIVVTGAAVPGYGQAITEAFLQMDYHVIGTYLSEDEESAKAYAQERPDLEMLRVDLHDRKQLSDFVEAINGVPLNALVLAQFFWNMETPDDFDHEMWDRSIATNLTATNYLIHELKNSIADGGAIVVITSTEGFIGSFGGTAYAAARAAQHNLVKSFANNLGGRAIRVNAVAAGWIGSVMDTDDIFNVSREITPLGRLGEGREIADVVGYLTSEKSSFITGHVLVADGGYSGVDYMAKYEFEESRKDEKA